MTAQSTNVSTLIQEIHKLNVSNLESNHAAQAEMLACAQRLTQELMHPKTVMFTNANSPLHNACVRSAINLDLFRKVSKAESSVTAAELAGGSADKRIFIIRLMRVLTNIGFVKEDGPGKYSATAVTRDMATPSSEACVKHFFDQICPVIATLPQYLEDHDYKLPTDPQKGPFQDYYNTDLTSYDYWSQQPPVIDNFNIFMGLRGAQPWFEWYPVEQQVSDNLKKEDQETVLLIDIAGGNGHDVQAFKNRFPSFPGRLMVQERDAVIDEIEEKGGGIEYVKHDMFNPQPIKGALYYYFHHIFHNWSDADCLSILHALIPSMTINHSRILLHEHIVPTTHCSLRTASLDLQMLLAHSARERTLEEFETLLNKAGLKVVKVWQAPDEGEPVVEAMVMG
ncbi:MAG: hypothetical protein M1827_001908 [Pycnora praestabilis]|nr:MAG: hypothetical protein M1827_001908 [Pycnora praestabilis]